MASVFLYLGVAALSMVYLYYRFIYRKLKAGEPPLVPGHWLFGNGKAFQEHAVNFLTSSRKRFGDVFTIRLLSQYWTIVLDVHSFERFSREKNFDFNQVQKQVNRNVFHYGIKDYKKMLTEASQKINGKYLLSYMDNFASNLKRTLSETDTASSVTSDRTVINNAINENQLYDKLQMNPADMDIERLLKLDPKTADDNDGWKQQYLREMASDTFFSAVFYTIFGRGQPGDKYEKTFTPQVFHKNFDIFHKYFNYLWLGLPHKLFPAAITAAKALSNQPSGAEMKARDGCSDYIKSATDFMLNNDQTEGELVGHNLVFMHVNYNTYRTVFWCMYKLMEDSKANAAIRKELEEAVEAKRSGDDADKSVEFTTDDINGMPELDSFLKEIFRWASGVFMVRHCIEDTKFTTDNGQTYDIRKGDKIAIYPPAIHKDPEIFENPEEFIYDRFVDAEFFKNGKKVKHPVIGFGSVCPGQKLSILEIKWFIMNMVNSYKLELVEGEFTRPNTGMYGHEILPPINDVQCRMKQKEGAIRLSFLNNFETKSSVRV